MITKSIINSIVLMTVQTSVLMTVQISVLMTVQTSVLMLYQGRKLSTATAASAVDALQLAEVPLKI